MVRRILWSLDRFILYLWNGNGFLNSSFFKFWNGNIIMLTILVFFIGSLGFFSFVSFLLTLKWKFQRISSEFNFQIERSYLGFIRKISILIEILGIIVILK
ncbi:hypothetical protein C1645_740128 [Glomus cerebriforme]|uniref:Uncharacterized protein n=1 Tax=Glomus cerebriforme TaxID=658196 RepID=A0A397SS24_9GLOM|nr:hypothetical protein C1645_740128 [Glomus cerebriforme]